MDFFVQFSPQNDVDVDHMSRCEHGALGLLIAARAAIHSIFVIREGHQEDRSSTLSSMCLMKVSCHSNAWVRAQPLHYVAQSSTVTAHGIPNVSSSSVRMSLVRHNLDNPRIYVLAYETILTVPGIST